LSPLHETALHPEAVAVAVAVVEEAAVRWNHCLRLGYLVATTSKSRKKMRKGSK